MSNKRLVLEILLDGKGAQGVFSTDEDPQPIWFENRIVADLRGRTTVRIKVGNKTADFIAFDSSAELREAGGRVEQRASLDFGLSEEAQRGAPCPRYIDTFISNPWVEKSVFQKQAYDEAPLPSEREWRENVPEPFWDDHDDVIRCFKRAFEIVGDKIQRPEPHSGFTRNFVYTEFANAVFVWGNCFVTMFGKYAAHIFPFIEILNNFYKCQQKDGHICRQINIHDGTGAFERNDPCATGGNIFAWAEWENYCITGDLQRLRDIYPPLLAFHQWTKAKRTWQNGTYFSSGWGCGMDNIPRMDENKYHSHYDHGHLSFIDITLQQIFNARTLIRIAEEIGELEGVSELRDESDALTRFVNDKMWDERAGLYKDLDREGRLVSTMHIGAFWAFLAGVAPKERMERMIRNLEDPAVFNTPCGTASTAVCDPGFVPDGGEYWRGGVWCITSYMVVRGLQERGYHEAAHRVAKQHVLAVAQVFRDTNSIWESYDPTSIKPGSNHGALVRKEFVGFSGVTPIAMLIEAVLGIKKVGEELHWRVNILEHHGVRNLRLGDTLLSFSAEQRTTVTEKPKVDIESDKPVTVRLFWGGGEEVIKISSSK